jgi:hypothetical protein
MDSDKQFESPFINKRSKGFAFSGMQSLQHQKARASSQLGVYRDMTKKMPQHHNLRKLPDQS